MKRGLLKKGLVVSIMLLLIGSFFIPSISGDINYKSEPVTITVNQDEDNIEITYEIQEYTETSVNIEEVDYSIITIGEESNLMLKGKPDVPSICRSIVIPDTAKMKIDIVDIDYEEIDNVLIAPSKGDIIKNVNPDDVPYEFGDFYNKDAWFPGEIATLREPYILRDFRGQVVDIYPIQYNPVKKIMRVYNNIKVDVYSEGLDTVNIINRDSPPEKVERNFKFIYKNHFVNFEKSGRYDPVSEQGNMLIITYDGFWDEMKPFVEWKNIKGIPTEMVNVSTIGNAAAIKTYIEEYYDDYGLTFVLLAGDAAQVPTLYTSTYTSSSSDPSYSYIVGSDNYQDLFIGRFSAQNSADLETQIERSIEYEKYPQSSAEWYHKGTGIASNQGPGDDGEYDDEHIDNIRDDLLAYTYTEVDQIYDPSATSTMVTNAVNDGRSTINYCGHGSPTSWGSSGFNNNDVNALTNDNMLPFISSVACNNGEFDNYDACFAEAWLRATNSGEPTGAIGMFASSQSQSWDPPMDAQDEIIDILIETYENNLRTSYGALCFQGTMHMMDEYGSSCYDETDAWNVFGDPSLQVRTDTPTDMIVEYDRLIRLDSETFELDVPGVKNALCAVSQEYELLGCAYTDETGHAVITFDEELIEYNGYADLVVTVYNKNPYFTTVYIGNSYPPEPPTVDGPTAGRINKEYEYTAVTTDPEGDQVLYMFDWGDGTRSEWFGPVISGDSISASHAWSEIGDYEIKARAKDIEGAGSNWSDPYPIRMDIPNLNIKAKGGLFTITVTFKNEGIAEADDIDWEISIEGGNIFFGRVTTGTITNIPAGEEVSVSSNWIIGLGEVRVKVTASGPDCYADCNRGGKVFFVYIKVNVGS